MMIYGTSINIRPSCQKFRDHDKAREWAKQLLELGVFFYMDLVELPGESDAEKIARLERERAEYQDRWLKADNRAERNLTRAQNAEAKLKPTKKPTKKKAKK